MLIIYTGELLFTHDESDKTWMFVLLLNEQGGEFIQVLCNRLFIFEYEML